MAIENYIAAFGQRGTGNAGAGIGYGLQAQQMRNQNRMAEQNRQDRLEQYNRAWEQQEQQEQGAYMQNVVRALQGAPDEASRAGIWRGAMSGAARRGWDITGDEEWREDRLPELVGQFGVAPQGAGQSGPRAIGTPQRLANGNLGITVQRPDGSIEVQDLGQEFHRDESFTEGGVRYGRDAQGNLVPLVSQEQRMTAGEIQSQIDRLREMQRRVGRGEGEAEVSDIVGDARADVARKEALARQSVDAAGKALDAAAALMDALPNYDEAIAAIDAGANIGRIQNLLPSFQESTQRFENAANRLGLNVIGSVTFGALSEAEMRMAMETAVPRGMTPQATRRWLVAKRDAEAKLAGELQRAALLLEQGHTRAQIAEMYGQGQSAQLTVDDILSEYGI